MAKLRAISVILALASGGLEARRQTPTDASVHVVEVLNCSRLVHYVRPIYPKNAKRRHIQGTVKLRAVISERGELCNIEVLQGDPVLVSAAEAAVKKWRYAPCLLNGKAVKLVTPIDVPFSLSQ